jgi:hypothetical protein
MRSMRNLIERLKMRIGKKYLNGGNYTVNSRNKGSRIRRLCINLLEEQGFSVAVVERTGRFIQQKDAFGVGDLLAINKYRDKPVLIQVTTNKPHTHLLYSEFSKNYAHIIDLYQYVWIDRKGFKIYHYLKSGKYVVTQIEK